MNYISYMNLLKEVFGSNTTKAVSLSEFIQTCFKQLNFKISRESLNFFKKDRNSISMESFMNGMQSMKYQYKQELLKKSEKMTNFTKNFYELEKKIYKKMATFFGKKDIEKRFLLSFRKINFKRNVMLGLGNNLKIIGSLDSTLKKIFIKSPSFSKKSSIEFFNVSCDIKIQKEQKVFLFLVTEDEMSILGKIDIEFNTMQDQSTVKRVYWLKDNKGISIAGVTLKALFMNDQMRFYQERLERHKDYLREQKFALLKEVNKLQNRLQLIENPKNVVMLFTGLNLISMMEANPEQEISQENQFNSRKFDQNSEKNENYENLNDSLLNNEAQKMLFSKAAEREEIDFATKAMPALNTLFGDVNSSKFDLISEIHEDEFLEKSDHDSSTKKEEINFDCDFSSINLDVSKNSVFWAENTRILNEFENEDLGRISVNKMPLKTEAAPKEQHFMKENYLPENRKIKKSLKLNLEEIRDQSEKSTPLTTQSTAKRFSFFQSKGRLIQTPIHSHKLSTEKLNTSGVKSRSFSTHDAFMIGLSLLKR